MNGIINYFSWSSIFAGIAVMLIVQFSLSLLGFAAGLLNINPEEGRFPAKGLTAGAMIWWIVSSLIAVYLGTWTAARLIRVPSIDIAQIHGIVAWAVTMLTGIYLFTRGAGIAASGAFGMFSQGIRALSELGTAAGAAGAFGAGETLRTGALGDIFPEVSGQIREFTNRIKDINKNDGPRDEIMNTAKSMIQKGPSNINEADEDRLTRVVTKYTDMSQGEAREKIDRLVVASRRVNEQVQEKLEQSRVMANRARKVVSGAAFASFAMLVLTFIAAMMGAANGAVIVTVPAI